MRLVSIAPATGGVWMSRPKHSRVAGTKPAPYAPFFLWALTHDHQVLPYDPVTGEVLVGHEILTPFDDPLDFVDALDEAEGPDDE